MEYYCIFSVFGGKNGVKVAEKCKVSGQVFGLKRGATDILKPFASPYIWAKIAIAKSKKGSDTLFFYTDRKYSKRKDE